MIEAERILLNHALEDPVNQPLLLFLMAASLCRFQLPMFHFPSRVRFKKFIQETLFSTMPGSKSSIGIRSGLRLGSII
ncbi:uncharacterized protein LOC133710584 isoform X3 [Rosa rugosa]|uniref:uncharacterized protein LOC133710584 isoform X3 n=1 Tax=Rosa rugosa TaxID=74645 RepID=UPI002B400F71|nr:uncharacterized protein LOC133710584 isoform X3 [Rosa rugosa]